MHVESTPVKLAGLWWWWHLWYRLYSSGQVKRCFMGDGYQPHQLNHIESYWWVLYLYLYTLYLYLCFLRSSDHVTDGFLFLMCSFFGGTAITLINDSFTSGPREWWVGKICLKNLQTTAAQELHELELHVIFCDLFRFWFLIFGFFFWGVISDWECYVTILPSPESTKSRNKCRTKHWRPNIESSAPCFDRAIVTMICGSSNDSLVVTWLMFGAWRGELGMTVWFLQGIWRFLYGFSHFLSSLIDEMSCEST